MRLIFRSHAIKRMFERNITLENIQHVLVTGKSIRESQGHTLS
ncbi:MAG: DUF4258 domain-containing protein [Sulfuricellaceae bacterium]|nr:DUF4258 domain-containing protein [Sulfuricellaceae bacterium]